MTQSEHSKLIADILRECGSRTDVRLWRQNTGVAKRGRSYVRFGIPGQADLSGIQYGTGRRIEIECKTGSGKLSLEQTRWKVMIETFGGIYVQARSVDDVRRALE